MLLQAKIQIKIKYHQRTWKFESYGLVKNNL
jgi:hypothetical protein